MMAIARKVFVVVVVLLVAAQVMAGGKEKKELEKVTLTGTIEKAESEKTNKKTGEKTMVTAYKLVTEDGQKIVLPQPKAVKKAPADEQEEADGEDVEAGEEEEEVAAELNQYVGKKVTLTAKAHVMTKTVKDKEITKTVVKEILTIEEAE